MAASAEYELEKRVERLELFPVELEKGKRPGPGRVGVPLVPASAPGPCAPSVARFPRAPWALLGWVSARHDGRAVGAADVGGTVTRDHILRCCKGAREAWRGHNDSILWET